MNAYKKKGEGLDMHHLHQNEPLEVHMYSFAPPFARPLEHLAHPNSLTPQSDKRAMVIRKRVSTWDVRAISGYRTIRTINRSIY